MGYSWDIRGMFTEYSWGIRMYRVCVGYVSGMCRECVERNGMRVGSSNFMQDNLHNEYIINKLNNIYFSTTCCAQNNTLRATREIIPPTDGTDGHGWARKIRNNDNGDNIAPKSNSTPFAHEAHRGPRIPLGRYTGNGYQQSITTRYSIP